jgi:hypothetical protein
MSSPHQDAGGRQAAGCGGGHPGLDVGGQDLAHLFLAEEGEELFVEVGLVAGQGGGFDVP